MFEDNLATTSTRLEKFSSRIDANNCNQFATTTCDEIGDHSTFGAERHPIAGIFDVASGHDSSIIDEPSNTDRKF